jgi:hypothetical protein
MVYRVYSDLVSVVFVKVLEQAVNCHLMIQNVVVVTVELIILEKENVPILNFGQLKQEEHSNINHQPQPQQHLRQNFAIVQVNVVKMNVIY